MNSRHTEWNLMGKYQAATIMPLQFMKPNVYHRLSVLLCLASHSMA